jgi:hypothetical protein
VYPTPKTVLMHFSVASWTRYGQRFDLDNLVTPVMGEVDPIGWTANRVE